MRLNDNSISDALQCHLSDTDAYNSHVDLPRIKCAISCFFFFLNSLRIIYLHCLCSKPFLLSDSFTICFMHFLSAFTYNGGIRGEKLRSGHVSDAPGDPQVLFSDPVPLFVCRNQQIFDIIV